VKSVRFERLLASTAFGLILALSSHAGLAQLSEQPIEQAVPMPDLSPVPPPTLKDIAPAKPAAANSAQDESKPTADKQDAAAPQAAPEKSAPTQNAAAPEAKPSAPAQKNAATPTAKPEKSEPAQNTAAPQAAPPPSVDTQVADALRDLINGKRLDRYVARKDDREGVERYYREHDYKPIWSSDGKADARAKATTAFLAQVQTDGLVPSDYPTPDFATAATPDDLAAAELHLTASVLKYAHDAQVGRINPTRVGSDISFKLVAPEPAEVLAKVASADDVAKTLDGYNPPQAGFKALKEKLAALRANGGQIDKPAEDKPALVRIGQGKTLHPGMKDARVIALRKRLAVAGDKNNPLYDDEVADAVKAFQTGADLNADGLLGPNTVRALNGDIGQAHRAPNNPIDTVLVNMERWRWLPRKLGNDENTYVMVNVPDFTLKLMHDGNLDWKTKIVVGKPGKATPMISAEMKYITVNPTWNVPPSIIENEYLPALQADPTVLDRYGLKIYQDPDGTVHIYQPPGAGNALGRIRFNFPNKFLVYQHDTPDKYLFKRAKRAYSHGCMRVQDPIEYATKLLAIELPKDRYTENKIEGMFGNSEININFPVPIPVHLTYQTAFVDRDGKLQFRDDLYGRDAKMIDILRNSAERRVAYLPVERAPNASDRPVRLPVGSYGAFGSDDGYSYRGGGPSFFDFLFGGGGRYQPPPRRYYRPRGFIGPHAGDSGRYSQR
jgi:murein L,D-transpeptidase YcbB/YkuD